MSAKALAQQFARRAVTQAKNLKPARGKVFFSFLRQLVVSRFSASPCMRTVGQFLVGVQEHQTMCCSCFGSGVASLP
eukprot:2466153-Rhodomonas_salina.3